MTLLVLGIDGAVDEYVQEAIDRGLMPNLERFIEEGSYGNLTSSLPPITIPAWVSMFSGMEPDKLDTYHMSRMDDDYSVRASTSELWQGKMLWDRIDGEFGLINVPGTSPVWPVNGYMIEGFPMVLDPSAYPDELEKSLPDDYIKPDDRSTREGRRKGYFENYRKREEAFSGIDRDVDTRIEVYQLTDASAHRSATLDDVLEAYEEVDEVIGERMEEYDDIIIVSDHGFTHVDQFFYVNAWLKEKGYLNEKEGEVKQGFERTVQKLLSPLAETALRPALKFVNDIIRTNTSMDFSPKGDVMNEIDFSRTEAFSFRGGANIFGDININDERFEEGIVKDREAKAEEIKEELEKEKFIKRVMKREDVYDEPDNMPDLIIETDGDTGIGVAMFSKSLFDTDAFIHKREGIMAARGPSFRKGSIEGANLEDIAPTIAHYMGQELEADGKVLQQLFSDDFEPKKPEENEVSDIEV